MLDRRAVRVLRDILSLTYVAGNGGYVADIGPVTYGNMLELVGAPEEAPMEDKLDLESAVDRAFLDCTCPYCSIHLEDLGATPEKLVRNIWRHHIVTAHAERPGGGNMEP